MRAKTKIVTGMLVAAAGAGCGEVLMDSPFLQPGTISAQEVREMSYDKLSAALFKGWDENRDGLVTPNEYQQGSTFPTTSFEAADSDGDGALNSREVASAIGEEARSFFAEVHRSMFMQADLNQDEQIDANEIHSFKRATGKNFITTTSLKRYDVDKDGRMNFNEFETYAIEKAIKTYVPKIS